MRKVFLEGSLDIVLSKLFILQMTKLRLRIGGGGRNQAPSSGNIQLADC